MLISWQWTTGHAVPWHLSIREFRTTDFTFSSDRYPECARGREAEAYYGWKPFMHNPQLKQWLQQIDVPTLVLRGAEDQIIAKS